MENVVICKVNGKAFCVPHHDKIKTPAVGKLKCLQRQKVWKPRGDKCASRSI